MIAVLTRGDEGIDGGRGGSASTRAGLGDESDGLRGGELGSVCFESFLAALPNGRESPSLSRDFLALDFIAVVFRSRLRL